MLEILGDHAPPPACSPSERRDRALSHELTEIAREIGARDVFVFRRVAERLYSHLGGVGRGAGWAGNIDLDPCKERHLSTALLRGEPVCVELERPGRIVGPYWDRSAVIVSCDEETLVIIGSPTDSVEGASTGRAAELAERVRALVIDVSPAKRLADELEVLAAVREVTTVNADAMGETLVAIAARARASLSAEFAAVATIPSEEVDAAVGVDAGAWQPHDLGAAGRALSRFAAASSDLPLLCQDLSEFADAPEGFRHEDGVSSLHVLPIGSPAIAVLLVVHAGPGLRGFTALCQRPRGWSAGRSSMTAQEHVEPLAPPHLVRRHAQNTALPVYGRLSPAWIDLAPTLLELSGYDGSARLVALSWMPYGDELVYHDGTVSGAGDWRGWLAFVEHPVGLTLLGRYELGSSDTEPEHWLLIDRQRGTLDVGLALHVQQLLATQPSELRAVTEDLGTEQIQALVDSARAGRLEREMQKTPEQRGREISAALARQTQLLDGLERYLDDVAAAITAGRDRDIPQLAPGRDDPGLEVGL